jgi:hypothetical protein
MPYTICLLVALVVLLNLLTVDSFAWHLLAITSFLLAGGTYWLFNQRPPNGFVRNLLLLLAGPPVVLVLMNVIVTKLKNLPGPQALLLLFALAALLLWLGRRLRRRN